MNNSPTEALLSWAVADIIDRQSLEKRLDGPKKLIVKLGVDPTSPDLHLGHAVVLRKLRQFQDLGHQAVLVIGDFTALIGDPSGRNVTRPSLTTAEIKKNLQTYVEQAKLILDFKKVKIVHNSTWLGRMKLADLIKTGSLISVNTLLEREDFATRLNTGASLGFHELLYPISQAIDSVELKADVEIGGWDQRLNLLMGRELQKKSGQKPQEIVVTKALVGLDGERKMSKSLNNYIGLTDSPNEMFGKVMSLPDKWTVSYGELGAVMGTEAEVLKTFKKINNPRDEKALVAKKIVALYHGQKAADQAEAAFNSTFRDKNVAESLIADLNLNRTEILLLDLVVEAAEVSRSQASRLIDQGAIRLDGKSLTDGQAKIVLDGDGQTLQVGKHIFRRIKKRA